MGQWYNIYAEFDYKDEDLFVDAIKEGIRKADEVWRLGLDLSDIKIDSVDEAMAYLSHGTAEKADYTGMDIYYAAFYGSYGWGLLLPDVFAYAAKQLRGKSTISIDQEDGSTEIRTRGGKVLTEWFENEPWEEDDDGQ